MSSSAVESVLVQVMFLQEWQLALGLLNTNAPVKPSRAGFSKACTGMQDAGTFKETYPSNPTNVSRDFRVAARLGQTSEANDIPTRDQFDKE